MTGWSVVVLCAAALFAAFTDRAELGLVLAVVAVAFALTDRS